MQNSGQRLEEATRLMMCFAKRTGLDSDLPGQRYLWTDAFAVCNFLGLAGVTGEARFVELALRLIDEVHRTLGRHRADDSRRGWISGLDESAGRSHPTQGGLRIGKKLPERGPEEAFDPELEWERDGQYFHYLTKWMHALDQASRATSELRLNQWARELAGTACAAFTLRGPGGSTRLAWKMSIDLSRPLVPSTGQHDPLDGFITCVQLQATANRQRDASGDDTGPDLRAEAEALASLSAHGSWETSDPLGIGGLLMDACRVAQLVRQGAPLDPGWLPALLAAALPGLVHHPWNRELRRPANVRLAFRELGLAIGLAAIDVVKREVQVDPAPWRGAFDITALLERFTPYASLGEEIESFWLQGEPREDPTWLAHRDINEVMLATTLAPEGFLKL